MSTLPYALRRVYADGGEEPVSEHPTFGDGWSAGQRAVHQDREAAYALYRGPRRLARFGSARLMQSTGIGHLPALARDGVLMFPEDRLDDRTPAYLQGFYEAEADHEDGAQPYAMWITAKAALRRNGLSYAERQRFLGRVAHCRSALRAR